MDSRHDVAPCATGYQTSARPPQRLVVGGLFVYLDTKNESGVQ